MEREAGMNMPLHQETQAQAPSRAAAETPLRGVRNNIVQSIRAFRVPDLQDAARSLGLTEAQVFFFIVFPQALRYIIPALVAQLVIVVKDTTFGYVVTYGELMQNAKVLIANYRSLVPVYLVVAVLYCLVNYAISRASHRLGRPVY